ncbi:MAG: hypothetical protein EPO54_06175 [Brevundimonas sp.]|nr:MAG: hypothetical protein EPO54_06175 [Brevundimonas sp.]
MSALVIRALDGGVAFVVEAGGQPVIELRMGWLFSDYVAQRLVQGARLSPPWTLADLGESSGWTDQGLEVLRQAIDEPEGGPADLKDQIFVRFTVSNVNDLIEEGAALPVFAGHLEPDGRHPFGYHSPDGPYARRIAVEREAKASQGGQDGDIGLMPQDVFPSVAVIGKVDGKPFEARQGRVAETNGCGARAASAAGRGPKDVDEDGADGGKVDMGHGSEASTESGGGVIEKSGAVFSPAEDAA